jgi:hypothetical protein
MNERRWLLGTLRHFTTAVLFAISSRALAELPFTAGPMFGGVTSESSEQWQSIDLRSVRFPPRRGLPGHCPYPDQRSTDDGSHPSPGRARVEL